MGPNAPANEMGQEKGQKDCKEGKKKKKKEKAGSWINIGLR